MEWQVFPDADAVTREACRIIGDWLRDRGIERARVYSSQYGESALAERLEQGRCTTAQNTAVQVPDALLHRGVVRYFREAGVTGGPR